MADIAAALAEMRALVTLFAEALAVVDQDVTALETRIAAVQDDVQEVRAGLVVLLDERAIDLAAQRREQTRSQG